jgi:hypothetical protein
MAVSKIKKISLFEHYLSWHYGQAYRDIYHVWMNFLWFCFNFFSINELFGSLLEPWKRMGEEYPKGLDLAKIAQTLIVNILMRFVGAMVRLLVIAIGLGLSTIVFLLGLAILLLWTVMPIFFVALVFMGISLIIYG